MDCEIEIDVFGSGLREGRWGVRGWSGMRRDLLGMTKKF